MSSDNHASGHGDAPTSRAWTLGPARPEDLPGIRSLVATQALRGTLLRRDPGEMAARISRWTVSRLGSAVLGCVALEAHGPALWEVRSLAVDDACQGLGIASALLGSLVTRARKAAVPRLFALTCAGTLFVRAGFSHLQGMRPGDSFHGRPIRPGCGVALAILNPEAEVRVPARAHELILGQWPLPAQAEAAAANGARLPAPRALTACRSDTFKEAFQ